MINVLNNNWLPRTHLMKCLQLTRPKIQIHFFCFIRWSQLWIDLKEESFTFSFGEKLISIQIDCVTYVWIELGDKRQANGFAICKNAQIELACIVMKLTTQLPPKHSSAILFFLYSYNIICEQ